MLVVGAGDMGEGIATALCTPEPRDICVINRTRARRQLADRVKGGVVPFGKLPSAISARPTCC